MMKKVYFLMVAVLLIGTTACGKDAVSTETTASQEQVEVSTEEETTEEITTETVVSDEEEMDATTEETATEATSEANESTLAITVEEAEQLIAKALGTEDEGTGNTYSFMHVDTITVDGVEYHAFTWGYYVEGTMSHLTDLFVCTDGSAIYEGMISDAGSTVYTETNFLE